MLRKTFTFGAALMVAAALVFLTAGPSQARPHGGFHGGFHGGAHFGGTHFGGLNYGGLHYGGLHYGGLHYGGLRYGGLRPYYHYGYHPGYRYNRFPYSYGYLPYYGYYPYSYNYYPYDHAWNPYYGADLYSGSTYDPDYLDSLASTSVAGGADLTSYSSYYSPPAQVDMTAHVTVNLPEDARLWFDDTLTTTTGAFREFHSPALTPGYQYHYDVKATWNENGHEVTQTQRVKVAPGAKVQVDFPLPAKATGQVSAAKKR
jgi:uncharacterized protein (TIGR03000 family)